MTPRCCLNAPPTLGFAKITKMDESGELSKKSTVISGNLQGLKTFGETFVNDYWEAEKGWTGTQCRALWSSSAAIEVVPHCRRYGVEGPLAVFA